jgi:hypothetical protein
MSSSDVISMIAVGISVISGIFFYVEGVIKNRERMVRLETKVEVFWKNVSFDAAKILHTPHPENARRDYLLEQFVSQQITRDQLVELIMLLKDIIEEKHREFGERSAASSLLRALESQYEI